MADYENDVIESIRGFVVGYELEKDKTFCDYCGAVVKITDKRCSNCKAKLNNNKI